MEKKAEAVRSWLRLHALANNDGKGPVVVPRGDLQWLLKLVEEREERVPEVTRRS